MRRPPTALQEALRRRACRPPTRVERGTGRTRWGPLDVRDRGSSARRAPAPAFRPQAAPAAGSRKPMTSAIWPSRNRRHRCPRSARRRRRGRATRRGERDRRDRPAAEQRRSESPGSCWTPPIRPSIWPAPAAAHQRVDIAGVVGPAFAQQCGAGGARSVSFQALR